jgi:hypothetical protein
MLCTCPQLGPQRRGRPRGCVRDGGASPGVDPRIPGARGEQNVTSVLRCHFIYSKKYIYKNCRRFVPRQAQDKHSCGKSLKVGEQKRGVFCFCRRHVRLSSTRRSSCCKGSSCGKRLSLSLSLSLFLFFLLGRFYTQNDDEFTKTGSGQTYRKT